MKFTVTVKEKGAPDFEPTLEANSPESAKRQAVALAIGCGWKNPRAVACREAA
jgi:hypothetical protein